MIIECDDCPYYGKNHHEEGDCFYWTRTRPCDNGNYFIGTWHKYPKEKPPKEGAYLVMEDHHAGVSKLTPAKRIVTMNGYVGGSFVPLESVYGGLIETVAWAELPEPIDIGNME